MRAALGTSILVYAEGLDACGFYIRKKSLRAAVTFRKDVAGAAAWMVIGRLLSDLLRR